MKVKYVFAALIVVALGAPVGACTPFSGFVADHWPRWAGGMPDDVPPRPGMPGYDEFIAHRQQSNDAAVPAAPAAQPATATVTDTTNAQARRAAANPAANGPITVVPGGLY